MPERHASLFRKLHVKELLTVLFILFAVFFFRQERHELRNLGPFLDQADPFWLTAGLLVTVLFIILQSGMLVHCFRSVGARLHWMLSFPLFLKRNFISTFIPGGSIASMAYLPAMLRKEPIDKHRIFQAAGVHGFIGILTVALVGMPVMIIGLAGNKSAGGAALAYSGIVVLLVFIVALAAAMRKGGLLHRYFVKWFPGLSQQADQLFTFELSRRHFAYATLFSTGIEFTGILHLYIAMKAIGLPASAEAALVGYVISTLFLIISPLLRGLGAVEVSLTFILKQYGFSTVQAVEVMLLYRLFEFWLPLAAGLFAWLWKGKHLFMRLLPPVMIFALGVVNIFSVLTPPIAYRVRLLREYLPVSSIHASNWLVILIGGILMVTAAFLFRGLRNAWWLALVLSGVSLFGHLTKALDYEEASLAFSVILILLITHRQYRQKSNARLLHISVITAAGTGIMILLFGTVGFHFLDQRHFGHSFTWYGSFRHAVLGLLPFDDGSLQPLTRFGHEFMVSLKVLGTGAWLFLFWTLIRPYMHREKGSGYAFEKAAFLLHEYGHSAVDHFKTGRDKLIFILEEMDAFIAYRIANGFAIVLEEPVCPEHQKIPVLMEFEKHCRIMGLIPAFYRVDAESLYYFESLRKKKLLIGQEAIMDVTGFSLEGRGAKAFRNTLNSLKNKGYACRVFKAPHPAAFLEQLRAVSDDWLEVWRRSEMVFSQGCFNEAEIREHDVIAVLNAEQVPVAFLNIVPDYTPGECTYDMIRKTADAPGGCMDALIMKLVEYAREQGLSTINLGLVPMSGIGQPDNTAERVVKYAYEKIRRFRHYQGQREFKSKYATMWVNKYLLYEHDFDLVQLPAALNKVMQPVPQHTRL